MHHNWIAAHSIYDFTKQRGLDTVGRTHNVETEDSTVTGGLLGNLGVRIVILRDGGFLHGGLSQNAETVNISDNFAPVESSQALLVTVLRVSPQPLVRGDTGL